MALKAETTEYLKSLAQQFGLDEKALLEKAEKDEKALKVVEDVVPRATFSRELDKARTTNQQEFESWKSKYYNEEVLPRWNEREKTLQQLQTEKTRLEAEAIAFRNTYGTLEGFQPSAAAGGQGGGNAPAGAPNNQGQWVSVEQYQKDLQQARRESMQTSGYIAKEMAWVQGKHREQLGKEIDVDAFDKYVAENQAKYQSQDGLRKAYADFVGPQLEEKAKTEQAARDKRIAEEAVRDYASKHNLPVETTQPTYRGSALFRQPSEDPALAALNDPNAPSWAKQEALRKSFARDAMEVMSKTG